MARLLVVDDEEKIRLIIRKYAEMTERWIHILNVLEAVLRNIEAVS